MNLHTYKATIARWVDGDTADLDVSLGFYVTQRVRVRLARIDAPERGQPGATSAVTECHRLAPPGAAVVVSTAKGDRWGRWIAEIVTGDEVNISDQLLAKELAVVWRAASAKK